MINATSQLDLFSKSLNPTYEIKRLIRLGIAGSRFSRDEIADRMIEIAVREGVGKVTKAMIDSWTKDSDPGRLPSLPHLIILCEVLGTAAPVAAMIRPLGCEVIGPEDAALLKWARAERDKRRAVKAARLALEVLE